MSGERKQVGAQFDHVSRQMGNKLGPIDERNGAGRMGCIGETPDRVECAEHIAHGSDAEQ